MTSNATENTLIAQMRNLGRVDLASRIMAGDSAAVTLAMEERSRAERKQGRRRAEREEEL